jgi:4-amino-4-deoxy-L-arabinose transferase-like glycosyltransferase
VNGDRLERAILLLILLAYGVLAVLYATQTPAWQVPDEPAHYNYARQVAESGCCPVLTAEDWNDTYRQQLVDSGFDPQYLGQLNTVQYEDHQPPLYYLLAAPIFSLSGGSLIALRLFSALLGAGVILGIYGVARAASGGSAPLALGAAAFVAFVPQHIAIMAGAGNDSLTELIVAVGTLLAIWHLTPDVPRRFQPGPLSMGLVMGLGFLTKASTLLLGPVIALALLLRWWREPDRRWQGLIRALILFLLPALILGALWWLRNIGVYGWPDILGLGRHDAIVIGQPRTADWIAREGVGAWLGLGVRTTFDSFWGQFGWMGVPMPDWVYALLVAFTLVSYAGLIPLWRRVRAAALPIARRDAALLLAALFGLAIAQFLYYNTSFVQFQGRYLYPGMAAFATATAAGWTGWGALAADRLRVAWLRWAPALIPWGLAGLSAYALWRFVLPNLKTW